MEQHFIEGADDWRKVIVGLQDESRFADIYGTYAHLYTPEQLSALSAARDASDDPVERDRMRRLWFEAADAVAAADVVQAAQDLTNERLAWRVEFDGEERSVNALGAMIAAETDYDRREAIYELMCRADEEFAERDVELSARSQELRSAVFGLEGEVAIANARMGIDVAEFSRQVTEVADRTADAYAAQAATLFPELLGRDVQRPSRAHAAYVRSLHGWDDTYTRERMAEVCDRTVAELGFPLADIPTILPDLEDRPEKDPRACVIPVRVPEEVHLVVRPTGGITDYQAFLHEAGHALHFGLTSDQLPFEHRYVSPDNALTEIYSYVVERITHEPLWHVRHFGVSREQADRVVDEIRFVDASLFRRYGAKLAYELEFWADPRDPRNPERYRERLSAATLMDYPTSQFASDMDAGLYAADYLRAWRTSEQVIAWLRREHGEEWFCNGEAADFLRDLFVQGSLPSNEDVSRQIGSSPDDFEALVSHLVD
ncbi:MAG: hypothetical protein JWM98_3202 [Thermoleophilia bacterium]|nr:hypothetical protein [Thermoleophilia bacterium]